MRTATVALAGLLVMIPAAAAQQSVDINTGIVTADNPLHGVDVALDDLMVDIDAKDPSTVTVERASELHHLQSKENPDPDRVKNVASSMEKHADISVNTVSKTVRVSKNGNVYVNNSKGTVRINDGDIHVSGPSGTVDITDSGLNVSGKSGDVSISDGSISVTGSSGSSIDINSKEIRVKAQKRHANLQRARQILEQAQQNSNAVDIQSSLSRIEQNEQRMKQLDAELSQVEERLQNGDAMDRMP